MNVSFSRLGLVDDGMPEQGGNQWRGGWMLRRSGLFDGGRLSSRVCRVPWKRSSERGGRNNEGWRDFAEARHRRVRKERLRREAHCRDECDETSPARRNIDVQ